MLVAAASFCLVLCLVLLGQQLKNREQLLIAKRLNDYTEGLAKDSQRIPQVSLKTVFALIGRTFAPKTYLRRIGKELLQAGVVMREEEFFTVALALVLGLVLFGLLVSGDVFFSLLCGVIGLFAPKLFLNHLKARRLKQLNYQIGDALLIIANSLRAGFGFLQAMDLVSKEMPNPIAAEFSRALREIQLGASTEGALLAMAQRVGSPDLDLVVTAVLIQRQVGGNLAEVLDNISHTIRDRIRIAGEIKTLTAQGKISGLIIGLLPVFLLGILFLINRDYALILFTNPIGLAMVSGGVVSQIIGFTIIKKIVSIEV